MNYLCVITAIVLTILSIRLVVLGVDHTPTHTISKTPTVIATCRNGHQVIPDDGKLLEILDSDGQAIPCDSFRK